MRLLLLFLIEGDGWDYYYDGDHYDGYILIDGVKYCDKFGSEEIVTISPVGMLNYILFTIQWCISCVRNITRMK